MKEPLEPVDTMFLTLLVSLSDFCARVPAVSRALLSTWLTTFSKRLEHRVPWLALERARLRALDERLDLLLRRVDGR